MSGSNNLEERVADLFRDYVRHLDDRRFAAWLDLFAEDAYYAVIRYDDHIQNNNLLVIGEPKVKLNRPGRLTGSTGWA